MIQLFNRIDHQIALARFGSSQRYNHTFGGDAKTHGFLVDPNTPLHLIYTFDTSDPLFPIHVDVDHLPLFYGFAFGGVDTAYRIQGQEIRIIHPKKPEIETDFPYPGYPSHFDSHRVSLKRVPYDKHDHDDALVNSAFFGLTHVTKKTLSNVVNQLDEFDFWDDEDLDLEGKSKTDYLKEKPPALQFTQGKPNSRCVYSNCSDYEKPGAMDIIAFQYFEPDAKNDHHLWADPNCPWGQFDDTRLIFQMCSKCQTFLVSNQST